MEKFIAQNEPLSNRPQVLEDSCDAVEEIWYNHPFTEDELNEIKTKLADTSIDIAELEQEKADWMESYKSRLKPLNTAKAKYLDQIKRKSEDIKDKCYKFLDHENKEVVLQHIRDFISVNTSAIHQALPFYVLKELDLVAGMHTAKEYSMGLTLQFPDLPSLKSESAIRQSVGFLRTAKHVIKDGKDQMAPLIESDDNRELFRKLAQAISNIPGTGTMTIA